VQSIRIQLGIKLQYRKFKSVIHHLTYNRQLEPLQKELASGQVAEFHYTDAPVEVNPPPGEFAVTHPFS
jgi:hypothetical protein